MDDEATTTFNSNRGFIIVPLPFHMNCGRRLTGQLFASHGRRCGLWRMMTAAKGRAEVCKLRIHLGDPSVIFPFLLHLPLGISPSR